MWSKRYANVTAAQNQPVKHVDLEFFWYDFKQLFLSLAQIFYEVPPGVVRDAKNMCVDSNSRMAESGIENNVRGFAADTGQRLQQSSILRDVAIVLGDQDFAWLNHVLRFGIKQADRFDVIF